MSQLENFNLYVDGLYILQNICNLKLYYIFIAKSFCQGGSSKLFQQIIIVNVLSLGRGQYVTNKWGCV